MIRMNEDWHFHRCFYGNVSRQECVVIILCISVWQMPEIWEDVRVTITRDKIPDENGPCANHLARDDDKSASLSQGQC